MTEIPALRKKVPSEKFDANWHYAMTLLTEGFIPKDQASLLPTLFEAVVMSSNPPAFLDHLKTLNGAGFLPLPHLAESGLAIKDLQQEIELINSGHFQIENPVHVDLNYILLRNELRAVRPLTERDSYGEFLKEIQRVKQGKQSTAASRIREDHQLQIRGLVYEAHLLRNKILDWKEAAHRQGGSLSLLKTYPMEPWQRAQLLKNGKGRNMS